MALATIADVDTYMGLSAGNAYEGRLTAILNGVSARIERLCSRNFGAADVVERANIFRTQQRYTLARTPVQNITAVLWGRANAATVAYSGSAVAASFQVTPSAVVLHTVSAAGVSANTTLTFTAYPTIDLLATAIGAVSGFSATVQATGALSKYLFPTAGVQLKFAASSYSFPLSYPNVPFFEYSVDYTNSVLAFAPWSSVNYFFATDRAAGPIRFPEAYQMLTVEYRGGYETIPDDLVTLACELTAMQFNMSKQNTSVKSESLADYSYSGDWTDTDRTIRSRLAEYIRIPIAGGLG